MNACSIGSRAARTINAGAKGRVVAKFARVCDLATEDGAIIALGLSGVERGPMNVLLEPCQSGGAWGDLPVGAVFETKGDEILVEGWQHMRVSLEGTSVWEARPDWHALRQRRTEMLDAAKVVSRAAARADKAGAAARWGDRVERATDAVCAAHARRDRDGLKAAVAALCGLGEGLTPQGDDWLAGWLLALRLDNPIARDGWGIGALCPLVLDAAASRTTMLSRAFLECAAEGEATQCWHTLLGQMARSPSDRPALERASHAILCQGATSGKAMLAGFLAGLSSLRGSGALQDRSGANS